MTNEWPNGRIQVVIQMARPPIDENDPLVQKQISIPVSVFIALKKAKAVSGKSEAQIVRDALAVELAKAEYKGD